MSGCGVHQDVNLQKRVAILRARLVQVHKVYAYPPLPIGFLDHHHIRQLVGIVNFSDEVCLLQLADFFHYSSILFLGEHLHNLRIGGKVGDTFNLCTMTEGLILSMSSWFQANIS